MTRAPKPPGSTAPAAPARAKRGAPSPDINPGAAPTPIALIDVEMPVRWRDLDAFSHVNNATFLGYVEEARLQWFQSLSGPWLSDCIAPVLAATHFNYRRPIQWPASLRVTLFAERFGTTSLTLGHRIVDAQDSALLYADGHSVLVWIDREGGRPAALPRTVRDAFATAAPTRS